MWLDTDNIDVPLGQLTSKSIGEDNHRRFRHTVGKKAGQRESTRQTGHIHYTASVESIGTKQGKKCFGHSYHSQTVDLHLSLKHDHVAEFHLEEAHNSRIVHNSPEAQLEILFPKCPQLSLHKRATLFHRFLFGDI